MGYKNDVFISYKNEGRIGEWVLEVFYPIFSDLLNEAIAHIKDKAVIFIDRMKLSAGSTLNSKIREELVRSRCMVAIWSPQYFNRQWCVNECAVMLYRQQKLNEIKNESKELIIPFRVNDGDNFPPYAKNIVSFNCIPYAQKYLTIEKLSSFEEKMLDWTKEIAKSIIEAPEWEEEWSKKEWVEDATKLFPTLTYTNQQWEGAIWDK